VITATLENRTVAETPDDRRPAAERPFEAIVRREIRRLFRVAFAIRRRQR
jgi:hypothetical protein